jgi:hypothetical protein
MGRSNTAPIEASEPKRFQYNGAAPARSATVVEPSTSTSHHIHLPHIHLPGHGTKESHTDKKSASNGKAASTPTVSPTMSRQKRTRNGARPGLIERQNSVQTRYMDMLLALDAIPRLHNILAAFFTYVLSTAMVSSYKSNNMHLLT